MIIEFTANERLLVFRKELSKKFDNLREKIIQQRNKIYAHNDNNCNFYYDQILNDSGFYHCDIETLIDFSNTVLSFILSALTGSEPSILNVNDFTNVEKLLQQTYHIKHNALNYRHLIFGEDEIDD